MARPLSRLSATEHDDGSFALVGPSRWTMVAATLELIGWWRPRLPHNAPASLHGLSSDRNGLSAWVDAAGWQPLVHLHVAAAAIRQLHLTEVDRESDHMIIELRVETNPTTAAPPPLRFSVIDLDRDAELVDLALRIARSLGLPRYRAHRVSPAHVELLAGSDLSPYRADDSLPVPAQQGELDYADPAPGFTEPVPPVPPYDPERQPPASIVRLLHWRPGQRIAVENPGWSRPAALLLFCCFYVPGFIVAWPIASLLFGIPVWAMAMLVPLVLYIALDRGLGVDVDALMTILFWAALVLGIALSGVVMFAILWEWMIDGYRDRVTHSVTIDWSSRELIQRRGDAVYRRRPLAAIEDVAIRPGSSFSGVWLCTATDSVNLAYWSGSESGDHARSAGTDLARALDVPARVETA